jgi:PhnB protein
MNLELKMRKAIQFFLQLLFNTAREVEKAFGILKENGMIIYPLHITTYSSLTGSLVDKYGFRWTLMTEQTEQ